MARGGRLGLNFKFLIYFGLLNYRNFEFNLSISKINKICNRKKLPIVLVKKGPSVTPLKPDQEKYTYDLIQKIKNFVFSNFCELIKNLNEKFLKKFKPQFHTPKIFLLLLLNRGKRTFFKKLRSSLAVHQRKLVRWQAGQQQMT